MRWLAAVLALGAFASGGCAPRAVRRAHGWWFATTAHVRLATNVDPGDARESAWAMEDLHRGLTRAFEGYGCRDTVTALSSDVTLIAARADYEAVAPRDSGAFYWEGSADLVPIGAQLVLPAPTTSSSGATLAQTFTHELTHQFVAQCFPGLPAWLNEGLASYFETLRIHDDEIVVGIAPYQVRASGAPFSFRDDGLLYTRLPSALLPDAQSLVTMSDVSFYDARSWQERLGRYAASWGLVHMLLHGRREPTLETHLAAIGRGEASTSTLTEQIASDGAIGSELLAYFARGHLLERHLASDTPAAHEVTLTPMAEARAHLRWAELFLRAGRTTQAMEHAMRAEAGGTWRPEALLFEAALSNPAERAELVAHARTLSHDGPDAVRAAAWCARDGTPEQRRAAIASLEALGDLRAEDLVVLADLQLSVGDIDHALQIARRSTRADPMSWQTHVVLGRACAASGDPSQARIELTRALDMTVHGTSAVATQIRAMLERLPPRAARTPPAPPRSSPDELPPGSLSRSVIQAVIRAHVDEARACYEAALGRVPTAAGRVVASFVIGPEGRVTAAFISASPIDDWTMHACLVDAVRSWQFPVPDGNGFVGVNYPFAFDTVPFDQAAVVRMIQARRSAIQACYQRELAGTPTLAGRIAIQVTIGTDGQTSDVRVTDSSMTGGESVGACVVQVIDGFEFDPAPTDGSVSYTFPFVFEPE